MKVFIDTNIILDILLERPEFVQPAMDILQMGIDKENTDNYYGENGSNGI